VLAFTPRRTGTRIAQALEFLTRVQRRRSLVFVLSDFQDHGWESALRVAGRRHDVIALPVHDAREQRLPDCGLVTLRDPETGVAFTLDTSDAGARRAWESAAANRAARLRREFDGAGIDHLAIEAGSDYTHSLVSFLHRRARRD